MQSDGGREKDDNLASNFGAAYIITDHVKARAGYGEAFRMPTAEQLAGDYVAWISYLGNPDLKPETSQTYEGGFDLTYAFVDFSVTGFTTDFKDKIEVYSLPTSEQSYKNIGGASMEGIESEVSFDAGAFFGWAYDLKPYGSIVYMLKYEDDETGEDLLYTEDLNAAWGLIFSDKKGLSTDLNFTYTGDKKVEDWENWSDPVNIIHCGGFTVANFSVHQKILDFAKRGGVTVKGEIRNIFDRDYAYVAGYPMPGRNFFLCLRYEY
jgi:vitamin B12 transporter